MPWVLVTEQEKEHEGWNLDLGVQTPVERVACTEAISADTGKTAD